MPFKRVDGNYVLFPEPPLRCTPSFFCSITAGCLAIAFLIWFVNFSTYRTIHDRIGSRPITRVVREGDLVVYPATLLTKGPIYNVQSYSILLAPENIKNATGILDALLQYYKEKERKKYTDCFVDFPTYTKPCFFERTWLGSCLDEPSFGYKEVNGVFNPCLILRLEKTAGWMPVWEGAKHQVEKDQLYSDIQFAPVSCFPKRPSDKRKISNITVYPEKGFPNQFFPVTAFDPSVYSSPAVAIHLKGIPKDANVTINCMIEAPNALLLKNLGFVEITFLADL